MTGRPININDCVPKFKSEFREFCIKKWDKKKHIQHLEDQYDEYPENTRYTDAFLEKNQLTRMFGNSENKIYKDEYLKYLQINFKDWKNYLENRCNEIINAEFPDTKRYAENFILKKKEAQSTTQKCRSEIEKLKVKLQNIHSKMKDFQIFRGHFFCNDCLEIMRTKNNHQCSKSKQV